MTFAGFLAVCTVMYATFGWSCVLTLGLAAIPALHAVPTLGLWDALRAPFFALWDEETQRMVGFGNVPER